MCWSRALDIYLVDGTYELFRRYYTLPSAKDSDEREVAAVRGVLASVLDLIKGAATHIAVATDHVIESFRNELPGYKTGEGIEPGLLAQFSLLEDVLLAAGVVVWPMVEFEADDALAAAVVAAAREACLESVIICPPDKDLAAMCARHAHRPNESPGKRHLRRGRCDQDVWRLRRNRSPITWHWWAMRQMVIRDFEGGVRSRLPPSLQSIGILNPFLRITASGT